MSLLTALLVVAGLALLGWLAGRARARAFATALVADADSSGQAHARSAVTRPDHRLHSLPVHHATYVALWVLVPALLLTLAWSVLSPGLVQQSVLTDPAAAQLPAAPMLRASILSEAHDLAVKGGDAFNPAAQALVRPYKSAMQTYGLIGTALTAVIGLIGGALAWLRLRPQFAARNRVERMVMIGLMAASLVAILTTVGIVLSLAYETTRFFGMISPLDFLFGTHWAPDPMATPTPEDGSRYGAIPLFWGTFLIGVVIAMLVAIPFGLMSAIYLTQYAKRSTRKWMKPLLEILAGIPTVVYGYFAALTVAPLLRDLGVALGMANPSTESALAAGLVMGVMIIPFVSSMADDSIAAVPQSLRDGSLAMGATTSETIKRVLLPAALPGIVAGIMLAISRAIGETMIVVMAAGAAANLSANPFESMTTVTFQIVAMLTGEGSFDHPATLSAFALGMVLFFVTLCLNIIALRVVKRFREAYD